MWWITNAPRERCMLTLAYSRKLADPPAAQPALHPCAFFFPSKPCSFIFHLFHFFPLFVFSPLLPLYLSIIIFGYQKMGGAKGKLPRSLLFSFYISIHVNDWLAFEWQISLVLWVDHFSKNWNPRKNTHIKKMNTFFYYWTKNFSLLSLHAYPYSPSSNTSHMFQLSFHKLGRIL